MRALPKIVDMDIFLAAYTYTLHHWPDKSLGHADALSHCWIHHQVPTPSLKSFQSPWSPRRLLPRSPLRIISSGVFSIGCGEGGQGVRSNQSFNLSA